MVKNSGIPMNPMDEFTYVNSNRGAIFRIFPVSNYAIIIEKLILNSGF
jgi:hypothetical protein